MADAEQLPPAHVRTTPPWAKDLFDWANATFENRAVDEKIIEQYEGKEVSAAELPVWAMNISELAMPGVYPLEGRIVPIRISIRNWILSCVFHLAGPRYLFLGLGVIDLSSESFTGERNIPLLIPYLSKTPPKSDRIRTANDRA